MMKKLWIVCIAAIVLFSAVCIIFGSVAYTEQQKAVDIIGGADGPTAIFVTGEFVKVLLPILFIGIAGIVGIFFLIDKRKKNR